MTPGREVPPQEMVERALSAACVARECVVIAEEITTANLRWAGNTLTTNGVTRSRRLTVIAVTHKADGVCAGVVSSTSTMPDEIPDLVAAAERAGADNGPAQDAAPLPGPDEAGPAGNWADPAAQTSVRVFASLATALGQAFADTTASSRALYGFAQHESRSVFLGTSSGLRMRWDQPTGKIELTARVPDDAAPSGVRSVWAGVGTPDFAGIDAVSLASALALRLGWGERRVALPHGRYETVLSPSAVAELMIYLYWSAGARDARDGRTAFAAADGGTRVGEVLCGLPLRLFSDPAAPGLECAPFLITDESDRHHSVFDNGLAVAPTDWIRDGRLTALRQTRHSAGLTGLPLTPSVDNLLLELPSAYDELPALIGRTKRALLVTSLWYVREVDPQSMLLTGLTRDGTYLIEDGEVVAEVNNFRFNESPVSVLGRTTEAGRAGRTLAREGSDYLNRVAMPPLRVASFNMSSVSDAS